MKRIYKDYVEDILNSIRKIESFTKGLTFKEFKEDDKTFYAVIRALEIIGEAAKKFPPEFKDEFNQIPWKQMTGMRDKLIHDYLGVDEEIVWQTIIKDIPEVKPIFIYLLNSFES